MFLDAFGVFCVEGGPAGIGEFKEVFAIRVYRGCGGTPRFVWRGAARDGWIGREGPVAVIRVRGEGRRRVRGCPWPRYACTKRVRYRAVASAPYQKH